MEQPTSPLNPWLLSYIVQYQHSRSRYEIDCTLLLSGYPAAEIEAAWEIVLSGQPQKLTRTPDEIKRQQFAPLIGCLRYGCITFLALFAVLVILLIIHYNPALPEPLPDYSAGRKLNIISALPKELLNSVCYAMEAFDGEKFQAFATADGRLQVLSFYRNIAKQRGLEFEGTEYYPHSDIKYSTGATCFSHGTTSTMFSAHIPTVAVHLFAWDNSDDARIIAQYFPNAPPKTNVILLLQGFKYRTLV